MRPLLALLLTLPLWGVQPGAVFALKTSPEHFDYYIAGELRAGASPNTRVYTRSGIEGAECVLTGYLKIRLKASVSADAFAASQPLKYQKTTLGSTHIFSNTSQEIDDMELASGLWNHPDVIAAEPLCQKPKRLL